MADDVVRQRVDGNLAWARDEVVVLVGTIALPGADRCIRLIEHLGRLSQGTDDPARRLALLLQMGAAMSGMFESIDRLAGVDPLDLADDLFSMLGGDEAVELDEPERVGAAAAPSAKRLLEDRLSPGRP
ncbi:MAG: hypothetical protein QOJ19_2492 [Acidimicrobiia bacterium]|jgi:hypothetical protein|nr:hypothetical protein [Acidimicrobiia bacterium]